MAPSLHLGLLPSSSRRPLPPPPRPGDRRARSPGHPRPGALDRRPVRHRPHRPAARGGGGRPRRRPHPPPVGGRGERFRLRLGFPLPLPLHLSNLPNPSTEDAARASGADALLRLRATLEGPGKNTGQEQPVRGAVRGRDHPGALGRGRLHPAQLLPAARAAARRRFPARGGQRARRRRLRALAATRPPAGPPALRPLCQRAGPRAGAGGRPRLARRSTQGDRRDRHPLHRHHRGGARGAAARRRRCAPRSPGPPARATGTPGARPLGVPHGRGTRHGPARLRRGRPPRPARALAPAGPPRPGRGASCFRGARCRWRRGAPAASSGCSIRGVEPSSASRSTRRAGPRAGRSDRWSPSPRPLTPGGPPLRRSATTASWSSSPASSRPPARRCPAWGRASRWPTSTATASRRWSPPRRSPAPTTWCACCAPARPPPSPWSRRSRSAAPSPAPPATSRATASTTRCWPPWTRAAPAPASGSYPPAWRPARPPPPRAAPGTRSPAPAGSNAGARPRHGGELRLLLPPGPRALDPAQATGPDQLLLARAVGATLLDLDPAGAAARPALLESPSPWKGEGRGEGRRVEGSYRPPRSALLAGPPVLEPGGRAVRLRLSPNLRFHDGAPVTAASVAASLTRLAAPGSPGAWLLAPVEGAAALHAGRSSALAGVRVEGELELRIALAHPYPQLPWALAAAPASVVRASPSGPAGGGRSLPASARHGGRAPPGGLRGPPRRSPLRRSPHRLVRRRARGGGGAGQGRGRPRPGSRASPRPRRRSGPGREGRPPREPLSPTLSPRCGAREDSILA